MNVVSWKERTKHLKEELSALVLAARDPRVPWYTKAFAVMIIGYALSPIDLIPDFIPVLGYVDDLLLLPAGIVLLIRMIPPVVLEECREKVKGGEGFSPGRHPVASICIILVWCAVIAIFVRMAIRLFAT